MQFLRISSLCGVLLALPCMAAPTAALNSGGLQLRFVPLEASTHTVNGAQGVVHFGTMAARAHGGAPAAIVVRQRVGIRIDGSHASARLSVMLADAPPGTVRVNGIPISAIPRVIDPAHRLGTTVAHEIELTIPADVPPGPLLGNLQWTAETD